MASDKHYPYDIAISYAGENRDIAVAIAESLRSQGVSVFYDRSEKATLWGRNLYNYLSDLYQNQAHYCLMLLSQHYAQKVWTNHEREAAQNRAVRENEEYILPIRLDETDIPGHLKTLVYLDWREETVETITQAVLEKLGKITNKPSSPSFLQSSIPTSQVQEISESQEKREKLLIEDDTLNDLSNEQYLLQEYQENKQPTEIQNPERESILSIWSEDSIKSSPSKSSFLPSDTLNDQQNSEQVFAPNKNQDVVSESIQQPVVPQGEEKQSLTRKETDVKSAKKHPPLKRRRFTPTQQVLNPQQEKKEISTESEMLSQNVKPSHSQAVKPAPFQLNFHASVDISKAENTPPKDKPASRNEARVNTYTERNRNSSISPVHRKSANSVIFYNNNSQPQSSQNSSTSKLFTLIDIDDSFAKAMIVEVYGEHARVLGVGRHRQSHTHMSDGIITDIPAVISNCNEALIKAEQSAGSVIAPQAIIGISGELIKGSSITISQERQYPSKPITEDEIEHLIANMQSKLLKNTQERLASETGYHDIGVRLINSAITKAEIDRNGVSNPIGFRGSLFKLTLFSSFAPLMQLGALETVIQGLDLILVTIAPTPYALARCLGMNDYVDDSLILIDISRNTTNITLVRQGGIEQTCSFGQGSHTFTKRFATNKSISIEDAERLKLGYSNGEIKGSSYKEIQAILAPECQTWMDSVELLIEELAKGKSLSSAIYIIGSGSALPDLLNLMKSFPWTERLPFSHQPIIRTVQPKMIGSIVDEEGILVNSEDTPLMALAQVAIDMQNENSMLEEALNHVIDVMHL